MSTIDRSRAEQRRLCSIISRLVPKPWPVSAADPTVSTTAALRAALDLHLQITPCARAVRVDQVVEHYEQHGGDREAALRWAILRAAEGLVRKVRHGG